MYCENCGKEIFEMFNRDNICNYCDNNISYIHIRYCNKCGSDNIESITISQKSEFWGFPAYETISVGYNCNKCFHREVW